MTIEQERKTYYIDEPYDTRSEAFRAGMILGREGERRRNERRRQAKKRELIYELVTVAFISFIVGAWLGVALTNIH